MNPNLNVEEREVVKLAMFFRKAAKRLVEEERLAEVDENLISSCEKVMVTLTNHADYRASVESVRENLKNVIKDNAKCPECGKAEMLKNIGVDLSEEYKCNKYKCRKCNITFVWNRPNNPWDMLKFVEKLKNQLESKVQEENVSAEEVDQSGNMLIDLNKHIATLKEAIEKADTEYEEMQKKDDEMQTIVKQFKKYLLIEKIKIMD